MLLACVSLGLSVLRGQSSLILPSSGEHLRLTHSDTPWRYCRPINTIPLPILLGSPPKKAFFNPSRNPEPQVLQVTQGSVAAANALTWDGRDFSQMAFKPTGDAM